MAKPLDPKKPATNAAQIVRLIGCPFLELVKGEGYWYFVYDDTSRNIYETESVFTYRLNFASIEFWVKEGKNFVAKTEAKAKEEAEFAALVAQEAAEAAKETAAYEARQAAMAQYRAYEAIAEEVERKTGYYLWDEGVDRENVLGVDENERPKDDSAEFWQKMVSAGCSAFGMRCEDKGLNADDYGIPY